MNRQTIADCMALSFADTPFPAVVQKLAAAGVQAYAADLIALRKTYYDSGEESVDESMPLTGPPAIAASFDKERVAATVSAIQRCEIGYAEFLRRIMQAGCARYSVFFGGRKAMYFGRQGDFHTEHFPSASTRTD
jgi:uncharacterized protein YbcV (DUF1398 family)